MLDVIRNVPLQHIRDFIGIADAGNMKAAQFSLSRSKEDITSSLQLLEQKIGSPLIRRENNALHLTSEARRLLPYANALVFCIDDIRRRLAEPETAQAAH
jgi:DNA-binding transcriptional LysR family regulator